MSMNRRSRQQRGAILVLMAILILVLIGIAALALDMGRVFVQRTELQNAADAAALAAAAELDGEAGATTRAIAAARQLLLNRGIYFGDFTADEDITNFIFYSSINPEPKVVTTLDSEARFVELTVDLTQTGEGITLYFLPVLDLIPGVDNVPTEAGTKARALAGKQNLICFRPPMFMCVDDPINWSDSNPGNDPLKKGDMVFIKEHGSGQWTPGNSGFLTNNGESGASDLSEYLASAGRESCIPANIFSEPGGNTGPSTRGINTRFDIYKKDFTIPQNPDFEPTEYPPAPNIISYPRDAGVNDTNRIGNGNWDRTTYWNTYHSDIPPGDRPAGWSTTITRWETYLWELGLDATGNKLTPFVTHMPVDLAKETSPRSDPCIPGDKDYVPNVCHGEPIPLDEHLDKHFQCQSGDTLCTDLYSAIYPTLTYPTAPPSPASKSGPPVTNLERRVLYTAAIDCKTLEGLNGRFNDLVLEPKTGRFVKFLLTEYVESGGADFDVYAEFLGVTGKEDPGEERVVIQLYE